MQQSLPQPLPVLQLLRQMARSIFKQFLGQQLLHQHQNTKPPALDKLWKNTNSEHVENCAVLREKVNIVEQFPKSNSSHHTNIKKISKSTLLGDGRVQFLASPILHNLAVGVEISGKGIVIPFSFVGCLGSYVIWWPHCTRKMNRVLWVVF